MWSAVGFWEGPLLLLACFSRLLHSHLFATSPLLCVSTPSLHSINYLVRTLVCIFSPHTVCSSFHFHSPPSPSFFQSSALFSVGNWRDSKRVGTESEVIINLDHKERESEAKAERNVVALTASRCFCLLGVIQRDSIGENQSRLVKKLQSRHLYPPFCSPWKWIALLLLLFLFLRKIRLASSHVKGNINTFNSSSFTCTSDVDLQPLKVCFSSTMF